MNVNKCKCCQVTAESRLEDLSQNRTRLSGVRRTLIKGSLQSLRAGVQVHPASCFPSNKINRPSGARSPTKHNPQLPNKPLRRHLQRLLPPGPLHLHNSTFPPSLRTHQQPNLADVERDGECGEGEGFYSFRRRWGLWDGLCLFFEGPEEG